MLSEAKHLWADRETLSDAKGDKRGQWRMAGMTGFGYETS